MNDNKLGLAHYRCMDTTMNSKDAFQALIAILFVVIGLCLSAYFGGGVGVIAALMYGGGSKCAAELSRKISVPSHSRFLPSQN
jgi:hypothetical protein